MFRRATSQAQYIVAFSRGVGNPFPTLKDLFSSLVIVGCPEGADCNTHPASDALIIINYHSVSICIPSNGPDRAEVQAERPVTLLAHDGFKNQLTLLIYVGDGMPFMSHDLNTRPCKACGSVVIG